MENQLSKSWPEVVIVCDNIVNNKPFFGSVYTLFYLSYAINWRSSTTMDLITLPISHLIDHVNDRFSFATAALLIFCCIALPTTFKILSELKRYRYKLSKLESKQTKSYRYKLSKLESKQTKRYQYKLSKLESKRTHQEMLANLQYSNEQRLPEIDKGR